MTAGKALLDYNRELTDKCLRVLALLLSGIGEWRKSVVLIGGLTPHVMEKRKSPEADDYTGTGDIDLVLDLAVMADPKAYSAFEEVLQAQGFTPLGEEGEPSWKWQYVIDPKTKIVVEFLMDDPALEGSKIKAIPEHGKLAACNIPHSSIAFDLQETVTIKVELPGGRGWTKQDVRHANIVAFTALKIFAFRNRGEGKDTNDLCYCIQNSDLELPDIAARFVAALAGEHGAVIQEALDVLQEKFCDDSDREGYQKDGPARAALFEIEGDSDEDRERRLVRQRDFAGLIGGLLQEIEKQRPKSQPLEVG